MHLLIANNLNVIVGENSRSEDITRENEDIDSIEGKLRYFLLQKMNLHFLSKQCITNLDMFVVLTIFDLKLFKLSTHLM